MKIPPQCRAPFSRCAAGAHFRAALLAAAVLSACGGGGSDPEPVVAAQALAARPVAAPAPVANGNGAAATLVTTGTIDMRNTFFQPFGNGRSCASCHDPNGGWSLTPDVLAARFAASNGTDPVFQPVDGANSPLAPVATVDERRAAYSMLLSKGLIRIGLPVPAGAEFELAAVDDPYHYASASQLSLFRRPLPSTNLAFITAIMWDGRHTVSDPRSGLCVRGSQPLRCYGTTDAGLLDQANAAVTGHAQAAAGLTAAQQREVVDFERSLFTAQVSDIAAGSLTAAGALGGPRALSQTPFHFGINDVAAGDYATGAPFNPQAMQLFGAWLASPPSPADRVGIARAAIARGERVFNTKQFVIDGVPGFNDELAQARVTGSCASCHSTPDVGTHSVPRFMNTGTSAAVRRSPDLPLYTLRNSATGRTIQVTDPGLALQTGKWNDIGKLKVPGLRGLESRSPYFHDGSESDVAHLIGFYRRRFNIDYTPQEIADLAAFLRAL